MLLRAYLMPPPAPKQKSDPPDSIVTRVLDDWYVAMSSRDLGSKPIPFTLFGTPMVLFRDADGKAGALLDWCPH